MEEREWKVVEKLDESWWNEEKGEKKKQEVGGKENKKE
jgi:hypothetical protein